jgi:hypothetical protein
MKTFVTKGGFHTWINSRESKFLEEHFNGNELLDKKDLNERDEYIAQTLVSRGVLDKVVDRKSVNYKLNVNNLNRE